MRLIQEEFEEDLAALIELLAATEARTISASARVAAANSATMLLAARFEEFVRQSATSFAQFIVFEAVSSDKLPKKFTETLWRRTFDILARSKLPSLQDSANRNAVISDAEMRSDKLYKFLRGDHSQDVFGDLIHNENNMRPQQLNSLFSVSGLQKMCTELSEWPCIQEYFGVSSASVCEGRVNATLESFMTRRNEIAHSLSSATSASHENILEDIVFLSCLAEALISVIVSNATAVHPPPT